MDATRLVIGVDAGGTRTRAVALDGEGREVGRAEGRCAIADAERPGGPAGAVADTCSAAAGAAGRGLPVDAVWAGLSGAGREAARVAVEDELRRLGVAREVRVGTDVAAAFHDAFSTGPGILLISGTGSIAFGRAEDGREARVGGWGPWLGDEGSGFAIGAAGLKCVARQADGRAPGTGLRTAVLAFLGKATVQDMLPWAAAASKGDVAALAPLVAAAAEAGDPAAREILAQAVRDLEAHASALLDQLGPWRQPPPVALTGGLIRPGRALRGPLEAALGQHGLTALDRPLDPAMGAAHLALAAAR
jgi:N-acetylglucosamine kinase-like BadF-type ATPase